MADQKVSAVLDLSLGPEGEKALRTLAEAVGKAEAAFGHLKASAVNATAPNVVNQLSGAAAQANARANAANQQAATTRQQLSQVASGMFPAVGRVGMVGAGLLAAHAAVRQGMETGGAAVGAFGNPYMSADARTRSILQTLPGVAPLLRQAEALNNRGNMLEAARVGEEKYGADVQYRLQRTGYENRFGVEQAGRAEAARQAAGARAINLPNINRDTATGEREFREQSRLLPIRRELAKAEREAAVATAERVKSEQVEKSLTERQIQLQKQRDAAARQVAAQERGEYGGDLSKEQREAARVAAVSRLGNVETELRGVAEERQRAAEASFQSRQKEAQARGRVGSVKAEDLEARSELLYQRADTYSQSAGRIAGMNPLDRQFGIQALKLLQERGPEGLPAEVLSAAQSVAPQTAQKILERSGRDLPGYKELSRLAPAEFGDVAGTREEAAGLAKQAEEQRRQTETEVARTMAEAGKDLGRFVGDRMLEVVESAKREIENRLRLRDAQ